MGRPLKKSLFGNTNFGLASTTTDDGLGGGSVTSIQQLIKGSPNLTGTLTVTIYPPDEPGGVQATATATVTPTTGGIVSVTVVSQGARYASAVPVTFTGGGGSGAVGGTSGIAPLVNGVTLSNAGTGYTSDPTVIIALPRRTIATAFINTTTNVISYPSHGLNAQDQLKYFHGGGTQATGLTNNTIYYVISSGLTTNTFKVSTLDNGSEVDITGTGNDLQYFELQDETNRATATATTGGEVTFTVTNPGSGYRSTVGLEVVSTSGQNAGMGGISPLGYDFATVITGGVEHIRITANVLGLSNDTVDIVRQMSSRKFLVKNANGVAVAQMHPAGIYYYGNLPDGYMFFYAHDNASARYIVSKITAHRVTIVQDPTSSGHLFASGTSVRWRRASGADGARTNADVTIDTLSNQNFLT